MSTPTHADVVARAGQWLSSTARCKVVFCELVTAIPEVPDAIGWGPGQSSVLVECKVSVADFRRDTKKASRRGPFGPGRERWYMAPKGVIPAAEVVGGWGLLEWDTETGRVRKVVQAERRPTLDNAHSEVAILLSALRRVQIGGEAAVGIFDRLTNKGIARPAARRTVRPAP